MAIGLEDDDEVTAPTAPLLDSSNEPVAQNAVDADRQAKLDQYLKKVREQRTADISDAGDSRITQSDRDDLNNANLLRTATSGIQRALNFTGLTPGSAKQADSAADTTDAISSLANKQFAQRQAGQQQELTTARQDQGDAEKMLQADETSATNKAKLANAQTEFARKQDVNAQLADPNSQRSKIAQSLAAQYLPGQDYSQATAAQLEPQLAQMEKAFAAQESRKGRVQAAQEGAANRGDAKDLQISQKQSQSDDKDLAAMEKASSPDSQSSKQAFGLAATKVQGAEAAEALIKQSATQSGGLDNRQMHELAGSVNKLIGGSNAVANVESLIPNTAGMAWAKTKEFFGAGPQGNDTQAFTARLAETVAREKEVAQQQIKDRQSKLFGARKALASRRPDEVANIIANTGGDVAKQFNAWGLPVPDKYQQDTPAQSQSPAPSNGLSLDAISAELAKRGGK